MASLTKEEKIQLAITYLKSNPLCTQRDAAHCFRVPKSTLHARIHGRQSSQTQYQKMQRLLIEEEASLIYCIDLMAL